MTQLSMGLKIISTDSTLLVLLNNQGFLEMYSITVDKYCKTNRVLDDKAIKLIFVKLTSWSMLQRRRLETWSRFVRIETFHKYVSLNDI